MKTITIWGIILLLGGCISTTSGISEKEMRLMSFLKESSSIAVSTAINADSLFNCEFFLGSEENVNVFVFDGNCSSCVSNVLDFITTAYVIDKQLLSRVRYYSKSQENDIFYYYFRKIKSSENLNIPEPSCFQMFGRNDLANGLYHVDKGIVTAYLPWNYY